MIRYDINEFAVESDFALPNIYDEKQLEELCAAPDTPALTAEEVAQVQQLYVHNFGLPTAGAATI